MGKSSGDGLCRTTPQKLKELSSTENDWRAAFGVVEKVIPSLGSRCEDSYNGPGEDIYGIIDELRSVAIARRVVDQTQVRTLVDYIVIFTMYRK